MKRPFTHSGWRQNKAKPAALLFWLALIAGYYAIIRRNNLTMEDGVLHLANWLTGGIWGPALFIALKIQTRRASFSVTPNAYGKTALKPC